MASFSRKKVLVTGGAGFIGSHLCERLLGMGHEVLCVDNFFTGTRENIVGLLDNPYFEVLRHDVTFPLYVEVDEIYNLACPASPVHYQFDPVQTTKVCVHDAINMLGLARRTRAKIPQASTSEVYGDPEEHPQRESYCGQADESHMVRLFPVAASSSAGRSQAAEARHFARQKCSGLATLGFPRPGTCPHHQLFPRATRPAKALRSST